MCAHAIATARPTCRIAASLVSTQFLTGVSWSGPVRYTFADPASPPILKRVEPTAIRAGESTDLNLLGEYLLPGRGARCVFGAGRSDDDGAGWTDAVVLDGQRATCPSAAPTEGARRDDPPRIILG